MHKKLIWSPLAEKDFSIILEYLQENWGEVVIDYFIEITDKLISQIIQNPSQYPIIHKKKKIRKCVITKHNTLFYRVGKESIDILRIYDTRQDPEKLKFK